MRLIASSRSALNSLTLPGGKLGCWLHFDSDGTWDLSWIVATLIHLGFRHFAVSGREAESRHDEIDDLVVDCRDLVLTTRTGGPLDDAAEAFIAVEPPGAGDPVRLVMAFAADESSERSRVSEMLKALNRLSDDLGPL